MKIAVTGATGFLGREILKLAAREGHEVRGWVHRHQPIAIPNVQWVTGQLDDSASTIELVRGCDIVIHTALARGDGGFMQPPDDPLVYYQTNVIGSLRLIEAAKQSGCRRFIFISSGTVHQRVAEDRPLDDKHPLWPTSIYGACKAAVETLIHAYGFSGAIHCSTVRPVSIYGVDAPVEQSKYFAMVHAAMNDLEVNISGGGKMVHVTDVAKAAWLLATTDESISGQTFPCCDRFISNAEIAQVLSELMGKEIRTTGEPKQTSVPIDSSKLERLGMRYGGSERLRETIATLIDQCRSGL